MDASVLSLNLTEAKTVISNAIKKKEEDEEQFLQEAPEFLEEFEVIKSYSEDPLIIKYQQENELESMKKEINILLSRTDKKINKYKTDMSDADQALETFKKYFGDENYYENEDLLLTLRKIKAKKQKNKLVPLLIALIQSKRAQKAAEHVNILISNPKKEEFSNLCRNLKYLYYDQAQISSVIVSLFGKLIFGKKPLSEVNDEEFETFRKETKEFLLSQSLPLFPLNQVCYQRDDN